MRTKDRILYESIKLFAKNGFEKTSMTNIADVIGIAKPSIYSHYKNKLDLFMACLEKIIKEQMDFVEQIANDESLVTAYDKLFALLNNCSLFMDKNISDFYYRFYFFPPAEIKEIVEKKLALSIEQCDRVVTQIISKGIHNSEIDSTLSLDDVKNSYNCLMDGLSCKAISNININNIWNIFWRGIKG